MPRIPIILAAIGFATASLCAQAPAAFQAPKEIAPGVFQVGTVKIDKNARTAAFSAKINMADGLIEYLIVRPEGSVHESLFVSEAQPQDLHMAMLLLGAKGMKVEGAAGPGRIDAEYLAKAPQLTGDAITIAAQWKDKDGKAQTTPVERWIIKKESRPSQPLKSTPAEEGPWLYTGSFFHEERFQAQVMGVFGAMVTFPAALINNPRAGFNNDQVWYVNPETVPAKDTPLEIVITLQADK